MTDASKNMLQLICSLAWATSVLAVLVACSRGAKRALGWLLALTLLCPAISVGGHTIRIELVLVPILLVAAGSCYPQQLLAALSRPPVLILGVWLLWVMFAGLVNSGGTGPASISWWLEFYGLARLVMVFSLFAMFQWQEDEVRSLIKKLALTAVPVGVLCIGQVLGVAGARAITSAGYVPASSPVFQQQLEKEESGYVFRSLGVFGNVSPNAYYFAIVAGCCLHALLRWRRAEPSAKFPWLLCGGCCLLGGISTMSGTFIAGLPVTVLAVMALTWRQLSLRKIVIGLAATGAMLALTLVCVLTIPRLKVQYDYQMAGLLSGERFKTRYDDEIGVTHEAAEIISQNPVWGGFGLDSGVFIGDSIFTLLGFYGGYCGAAIFLVFLVLMFGYAMLRSRSDSHAALWLLAAVIFGVSTTSVFTLRLSDWWWAMMGIASACAMRLSVPRPAAQPVESHRLHQASHLQAS